MEEPKGVHGCGMLQCPVAPRTGEDLNTAQEDL